jgi:predicted RNA-binding protein with PIN domain
MRWVVDGYNVIRRDPDLAGDEERSLDAGRAALLRLAVLATERSGDPFTIVFDGAPGARAGSPGGQIEIVFSRPPETADDVVVALARRHGAGVIVVTSDRRVSDAARRAGATAVSAERFVRALRAFDADAGDAGAADAGDDETDPDADHHDDRPKRGNPRRISADERAIRRALRRLDRPGAR